MPLIYPRSVTEAPQTNSHPSFSVGFGSQQSKRVRPIRRKALTSTRLPRNSPPTLTACTSALKQLNQSPLCKIYCARVSLEVLVAKRNVPIRSTRCSETSPDAECSEFQQQTKDFEKTGPRVGDLSECVFFLPSLESDSNTNVETFNVPGQKNHR